MSGPIELRPAAGSGRAAQRGVSIVELMVGIVVAMLVSLAAFGSAIVFTAAQRQGVAAGGTSVAAATSLAAIKNDAALAGLGFFGDSAYLCLQLDLGVGAATIVDGADFTPVEITAEAAGDRIDIVYGERVESGANVLLDAASDGSSAQLMSLLPVQVDQSVLLAPQTPGTPCLVRTVTANTASTDETPQILTFDVAGSHNQAAFTTAPAFAAEDRIAMLGTLRWSRYQRVDNTLVLTRPLTGETAVLARDVIALRAQYGVAAAVGQTTLDHWQDPTGAFAALAPADLPRVRALRIGIVTRSPQRDKPDGSGVCQTTTAMPQLFGAAVDPDVADWTCYRYRVTTVVVPLRNLVLGLAG